MRLAKSPLLPLEPLYRVLQIEQHDLEKFCAVTGAKRHVPAEARYRGGLTVWMADRLAIGAGLHPSEVWPEWFTDAEVLTD